MDTHISHQALIREVRSQLTGLQRFLLFFLLLICGLAVLFLGSNTFDILPTNKNLSYNLIVSTILLIGTLWLRTSERGAKYWQMAYAFLIASLIWPITWLTIGWKTAIMNWLALDANSSSMGIAVDKLFQMVVTVIPILVLVRISGADFETIYLKRGNMKLWLPIGALVLFNFATSAFLFFAMRFSNMDKLLAALLWGLVFSFANGFLEELWLRAIFLRRFEPFLGMGGSILLTSLLFASIHGGASYLIPISIPFILANTFSLGIACGYLMMKSKSIWGAVIVHAAADLFLFIAILAIA